MNNSIILKNIKEFQESPYGHPLTCRKGCTSPRPELIGTELNGKVVLICPNCGYVQELLEGDFDSEDDVSMEERSRKELSHLDKEMTLHYFSESKSEATRNSVKVKQHRYKDL